MSSARLRSPSSPSEPLRERPRELLMQAYSCSGHQPGALEAFQEARRAFVEELGIEPGRRLQEPAGKDPAAGPDPLCRAPRLRDEPRRQTSTARSSRRCSRAASCPCSVSRARSASSRSGSRRHSTTPRPADPLEIPPQLGELERRLTLARLVSAWAKSPVLGAAGGRRPGIDAAARRRPGAADGRHGHARRRLERARPTWSPISSINIGSIRWISCGSRARPGRTICAEVGRIEPAARRDQLIDAEARRLTARPEGPVIAAGSTGSMPATAKFLHAVAGCRTAPWCCPGWIPISTRNPGRPSAAFVTRRANSPRRRRPTIRNTRCTR